MTAFHWSVRLVFLSIVCMLHFYSVSAKGLWLSNKATIILQSAITLIQQSKSFTAIQYSHWAIGLIHLVIMYVLFAILIIILKHMTDIVGSY